MVYFQKLEDSSYKALKIGIGLNILSVIDMIRLKRTYNPITAMGFSAMFTFQLDKTKR